jgi:seryl-tRNA synthetase
MKKLTYLITAFALLIFLSSCNKIEADKDVDNCINKLNLFNNDFEKFYEDGVISKDTLDNEESSEYDKLNKLASEYYELVNNINNQLDSEKNKKAQEYKEAHQKALENKDEEINSATALFEENLKKMQNENDEPLVVDETESENQENLENGDSILTDAEEK